VIDWILLIIGFLFGSVAGGLFVFAVLRTRDFKRWLDRSSHDER